MATEHYLRLTNNKSYWFVPKAPALKQLACSRHEVAYESNPSALHQQNVEAIN